MNYIFLGIVLSIGVASSSVTAYDSGQLRSALDSIPLQISNDQNISLPGNLVEIEQVVSDSLSGPGIVRSGDVLRIANAYLLSSDTAKALGYYRVADSLAMAQLDSVSMGWAECGMAVCEFADEGNLGKTTNRLYRAVGILESLNVPADLAAAYSLIGHWYWDMGQLEWVEAPLTQASVLYGSIGDLRSEAGALESLALLKAYDWELDSALVCASRSLENYQRLNDREGEARSLRLMGLIHLDARNRGIAVQYLTRSCAVYRELGDKKTEAEVLYRLGICQSLAGSSDAAIKSYLEAASIAQQIGDPLCESASLFQLGATLAARGEYSEAIGPLERAMAIVDKHNIEQNRLDLVETLEAVRNELSEKNR